MEEVKNPHTGSNFDEFLEKEQLLEEIGELSKVDIEYLEELKRSCPRCGKTSANKSNPSGRCSACLKKLASNKKKPGHYLHNHKVADDALRRQDGKNGTASKKSSGRGSRKDIISKVKAGEKKAGTVLSPDRKDNSKGYSSSNTRMVPPKLNRGRHKVDPKKLAAWKKNLKKNGIELDDLKSLMTAHAYDTGREDLAKTLEMFDDNFLEQLFQDVEGTEE